MQGFSLMNVLSRCSMRSVGSSFNMSYSDSVAVCRKRFLELGLSEANYDSFHAEGLNTLGTFAFSCNFAPGSSDERPLVTLATNALGTAPTTRQMACIRRLFSEAYSTIAADIRSKVEATDDSVVKRLAPAERSQRLRDQQARLTGLDLRGNFGPGDSLVDKAVACYESDRLCYISWDACVSRDHEILTGSKRDTSLTFDSDSSGSLKLTKRDQVEPCNASNEIQVRYCLIRRGLALDQGNIFVLNFTIVLLKSCGMEEPPAGCMRVSLKQIETADKKFWTLLSEKTRDGIKSGPEGRPCDKQFDACFNSPEFLNLLQHRFGPSNPSAASVKTNEHDEPKPKKVKTAPAKGSSKVPDEILHKLCNSANPIYELEILPTVLAVVLWGRLLEGSQCIFYLDNDAARSAFIKGYSATVNSSPFMERVVDVELHLQLKCWFSRVPCYSSVSDDPRRLIFDTLLSLGAEQTDIQWSWVCEALEA